MEIASVLFMDIVGYSKESIEQQTKLQRRLKKIVGATVEYKTATERASLISLPTGDGMALVFFDLPMKPVECAVATAMALREYPEIQLRMGVHSGPVTRISDINANVNVAGGGINMAQRVMDAGDGGHILVSQSVAEVLQNMGEWRDRLRDLGDVTVKHGVKIRLYQLLMDGLNQEIPSRIAAASGSSRFGSGGAGGSQKKQLLIGGGAVLALAAAGAFFAMRPSSAPKQNVEQAGMPMAVPAGGREISYWIKVQKFRDKKPMGKPFQLNADINFEQGYGLHFGFQSPQEGCLYVINQGPNSRAGEPDFNVLFPAPHLNDNKPRIHAGAAVVLPKEEGEYIQFDAEEGTENLWMVWAAKEIPELEAARAAADFGVHQGKVVNVAAAQRLEAYLNTQKKNPMVATADEVKQQTTLKSAGDVLVSLRKLSHH